MFYTILFSVFPKRQKHWTATTARRRAPIIGSHSAAHFLSSAGHRTPKCLFGPREAEGHGKGQFIPLLLLLLNALGNLLSFTTLEIHTYTMNTKKTDTRKVQIKRLIFSPLLLSTNNLKLMVTAWKVFYK